MYYIVTPFVNQIATKLKLVSKKYNFDTVFSNRNKTNIFFNKLKDKDYTGLKSNVVYNIPSKNCDKMYIGQTKRYLKTRISVHENNYKKGPKQHTALTRHELDNSHRFDFNNVKILTNEKKLKKKNN